MNYKDLDYNCSNPLGYDKMKEFGDEAFFAENLNIVVLKDNLYDFAKIQYINNTHRKILLKDIGEVHMGNYSTLSNFLTAAKNIFQLSGICCL